MKPNPPDVRGGAVCGSFSAEEYVAAIPMWTKNKNSIADIRTFLEELAVSQDSVIHVAGTNGKGSVCAYLTSVLCKAGFSVGTFVSPHLGSVRERFLLNGEPVDEERFSRAFERVLSVTERLRRQGFAHPSYFEFCFYLAMALFDTEVPDFRILETGLGGRLDATNAVKRPLACVITSVSLDHTQILGDTIEKIAREKAGIIKAGVPVIYDASEKEAARVIAETAERLGAPAFPVTGEGLAEDLPFSAPYQRKNAALAVKTLSVLAVPGVGGEIIRQGLSEAFWPGRMEEAAPGVWLDGAHNPGGIRAFTDAVKQQGPAAVHLLFAAASDKDIRGMIRPLCEELCPSRVTVTAFKDERAADPYELAGLFKEYGCDNVQVCEDCGEALAAALCARGAEDRLYLVGSLYLIGALRGKIKETEHA